MVDKINRHTKKRKALSPFYHKKIFLIEIFFLIKWTEGFFILMWRNNNVKWKSPPATSLNSDCAQLNVGNMESLFANQNESESVSFNIRWKYNKVIYHGYFRGENTTIVPFEKINILKLVSYFFELEDREKGQIFLDN